MRYLFSRLLSKVPHPVKGLYEQNGVFDGVLIKNLNMIIVGGAFGTVFGTIVSGSTYAGFIKALDFSDFQYGLLLGIPIVANFSQLVASRVIERNGRRMKWFFISGFTHRAIWIVAAFIPYMFPDSVAESRIWAVLFIATLTAVSGSFINITFNSLLADVTPIGIRGKYLSIRSKIATLASMVVGLLAAWLLDSLHGFLPFTIVFIVAAFAGIYDISRFFHVKAPPMRLAE
ncbi:MAG: MFS transporter, partial [Oscillospiraceae bacterium]|nr:MFS transporter [Oscillospiraceae bacterium]